MRAEGPGRLVQSGLSPEAKSRLWGRIQARGRTRRARQKQNRLGLGGLSVAAAAAAALSLWVLRTPEDAPLRVGPDEARITAQDGTQLIRCTAPGEASCFRLGTGHARFEVVARPRRRGAFVVRADDVTIQVLGTRFEVENGPGDSDVVVRVEEGRVSVEHNAAKRILHAGQTWPIAGAFERALEVPGSPPPATRPSRAKSTPSSTRRPRGSRSPATSVGRTGVSGIGAAELWATVDDARRREDAGAERNAYTRILRLIPGTRDAGLAGLALGRMELETFRNPRLAASLLRDSRRVLAGSSLEPEVLVLLTRAYARSGDDRRCRATARDYVARFPSGVYARSLSAECPEAR